MNETKQRIAEYKKKLPGLKEKVIAVALLLVFSVTMLTTVSFAWLSLSNAPEVTGVSTSIASNGNLEIALATGNRVIYSAPDESKVGDSKLPLQEKNITWGNLINLSDPAYGLDNLVLRPALLNETDLLGSPLYGAVYTTDGRVDKLNSNFGYTAWQTDMERFALSESLGVSAISSLILGESSANKDYVEKLDSVKQANLSTVGGKYGQLTRNDDYMGSIAKMMGTYMTYRLNDEDQKIYLSDITNLCGMYTDFLEAFDAQADAIAMLLNLQRELLILQDSTKENLPTYTGSDIYNLSSAELKNAGYVFSEHKKGGVLAELDQFIKDHNTIVTDLAFLQEKETQARAAGHVYWAADGMNTIVNHLVTVADCQIVANGTTYRVGSIGASTATQLLGVDDAKAIITNGILYRFDQRCGTYIQKDNLTVSVKYIVTVNMDVDVSTSADRSYNLFDNDLDATENMSGDLFTGDWEANDTYGLAVDLWVRTNAQGNYLTLEGNVLTETTEERATGTDATGTMVEIYTVPIEIEDEETGETTTVAMDVYPVTAEDGTQTWYYATSHTVVEEEALNGQTPTPKMISIENVIGFEGENRVWGENELLSINSTTQGSGSCYVYYANTPEDQARSLELLKSMKVAFVDANGRLLAVASMDTERHYAANGKVTVPLVLASDSINLGTDYEGNTTLAITALEQNVPTLITAIVYLDGANLNNEDVLASADIQGQLNIQFGSSTTLEPIANQELEMQELVVTGKVDKTEFNYDTDTDLTTNVTISVSGTQPSKVTAFFMRAVNATQGAREATVEFTDADGDGAWTAPYTFKYPGNYVLRSVQLDGVDYTLANDEFPTVTVKGFEISNVFSDLSATVMTGANSYFGTVSLQFMTNDPTKMPSVVQGRFIREDGTTANVDFTYNPTNSVWSGNVKFVTSGKYTMQYVILDGQYTELPAGTWQTVDVKLGMRVNVETTSAQQIFYATMTEEQKALHMQVEIMDNTGAEVTGLSDAHLYYGLSGSSVEKLHAELTWNAAQECYIGEFITKPGIYSFSDVKIVIGDKTNTLTTANADAPVFTVIPPEPPMYVGYSAQANQYVPNPDFQNGRGATMSVTLKNVDAAIVRVLLVANDGSEEWVDSYTRAKALDGSGNWNYTFMIPDDGTWTVKEVKAWNVFDENTTFYAEPDEVSDESLADSGLSLAFADSIEVTALYEVKVTFNDTFFTNFAYVDTANNSKVGVYGKDANGNVVSAFMTSHTLPAGAISATITDGNGNVIDSSKFIISDVSIKYTYANDTKYGGYTTSDSTKTNGMPAATFNLVVGNDGKTFTSNAAATFQYAAKYVPTEFAFTITAKDASEGTTRTINPSTDSANAPVFEVWSAAPTVAITDITPDGTYAIDETTDGTQISDSTTTTSASWGRKNYTWHRHASHKETGYTSSISADKLSATVYFRCQHSSGATWSGGTGYSASNADYHAYYGDNFNGIPTVTLTLNGISNFNTAVLNFSDNTRIYSSVPYTAGGTNGTWETTGGGSGYSWTKGGSASVTKYIGYCWSQKERLITDEINAAGKKIPAGTITADTLVVTYNNVTYTFKIPTITINNPY